MIVTRPSSADEDPDGPRHSKKTWSEDWMMSGSFGETMRRCNRTREGQQVFTLWVVFFMLGFLFLDGGGFLDCAGVI